MIKNFNLVYIHNDFYKLKIFDKYIKKINIKLIGDINEG